MTELKNSGALLSNIRRKAKTRLQKEQRAHVVVDAHGLPRHGREWQESFHSTTCLPRITERSRDPTTPPATIEVALQRRPRGVAASACTQSQKPIVIGKTIALPVLTITFAHGSMLPAAVGVAVGLTVGPAVGLEVGLDVAVEVFPAGAPRVGAAVGAADMAPGAGVLTSMYTSTFSRRTTM